MSTDGWLMGCSMPTVPMMSMESVDGVSRNVCEGDAFRGDGCLRIKRAAVVVIRQTRSEARPSITRRWRLLVVAHPAAARTIPAPSATD